MVPSSSPITPLSLECGLSPNTAIFGFLIPKSTVSAFEIVFIFLRIKASVKCFATSFNGI